MIVGMILDVSQNQNEPGTNTTNGCTMLAFYNYDDAVAWATRMSSSMTIGENAKVCYLWTAVYNPITNERRSWYNGVEYDV